MTSMIFGSIYMGHQAFVHHKRQKQREKNYRRWEDLRDEYDEQKRVTRETRSLDIQRTGAWGDEQYAQDTGSPYGPRQEQPILTLRDQQEANDARLSWRPQEAWEPSHRASNSSLQRSVTSASPTQSQSSLEQAPPQPHLQHAATTPSAYWQNRGQLKPQKTGATWDEGLPAPLRVSRRSYDDYEDSQYRRSSVPAQTPMPPAPIPRQGQVDLLGRSDSRSHSQSQSGRSSAVPSRVATPGPAPMTMSQSPLVQEVYTQPEFQTRFVPSGAPLSTDDLMAKLANISVEPVQSHVPGGRMAELIERGY